MRLHEYLLFFMKNERVNLLSARREENVVKIHSHFIRRTLTFIDSKRIKIENLWRTYTKERQKEVTPLFSGV